MPQERGAMAKVIRYLQTPGVSQLPRGGSRKASLKGDQKNLHGNNMFKLFLEFSFLFCQKGM
jgi:hypothetical protein